MKALYLRIMSVLMITALLLCAGCSGSASEKTPSNYNQLYALIGKPVAEVCQTLELDEEAVTAAIYNRKPYTIGTVEYAGITWNVELLLEGKTSSMYGFQYSKHYDNSQIKQAAEDTVSLVGKKVKNYGDPGEYGYLGDCTAKELQENTEKHTTYEVCRWELTDQINSDMQAYFQSYTADAEGEYIPEKLSYVMDLSYTGNAESGVHLKLEYKVQIF